MKRIIPIALLGLFLQVKATIITVPGDYSSIKAAINFSGNGDTIVVSPGTYYENINFRGKKVLLTSLYYLAGDTSYISTTIINGSTPANPDTASCVIFNSGEDSTSILQGFTLTGGTGTKWLDIHGAGTFREGGGIIIELCSPTVRCNTIRDNFATNTTGVSGAGGGGIRIGDGNPLIENNRVINNEGRYGAGIVLNYTGCIIRNNVIASNSGGQTFYGGSGIWITSNLGSTPKIIVNNTIVNNFSTLPAVGGTGGIFAGSANNVIIKNNIIWGNLPATQIKPISTPVSVTYSDVEGGYTGTGNFSADPLFDSDCYLLSSSSPCIDAGDSSAVYDDIAVSNVAVFPSLGTARNDVGAYGGPFALVGECMATAVEINETSVGDESIKIFPNPSTGKFLVNGLQPGNEIFLFDRMGKGIVHKTVSSKEELINLDHFANGIYFLMISYEGKIIEAKEIIKN